MRKPVRKLSAFGGLAGLLLSTLYLGTAEASHVGCGTVITADTTLDGDIGPCAGDGIIIGANNITLDLNGHSIFGTPEQDDGSSAGVRLPNVTGVTITSGRGPQRSGTIRDFAAGIFINGGSSNNIGNLVIRDNVSPGGDALLGDGIALFHSGRNRIINNLVARNGPFDGIGVLGSDSNDNRIARNTVEETVGFVGGNSGEGTGILLNNFLDEEGTPRRGEPISNNQVLDNLVRRNYNSGISNVTHVRGRIVGNTVEDNGTAGETCEPVIDRSGQPVVDPETGEQRIACRPTAFPSNGIGVTRGPGSTGLAVNGVTQMFISSNRVTGNTGDGIALGGGGFTNTQVRENRVIGNVATGNGGSGNDFFRQDQGPAGRYDLHDHSVTDDFARQPSCDANVWSDNTFNTAFPVCATGGLGSPEGPEGDPSCNDTTDNDLDGAIDEGDPNCMPPPVRDVRPPPPPGDAPPPGGSL
jgi:hypothetical protein